MKTKITDTKMLLNYFLVHRKHIFLQLTCEIIHKYELVLFQLKYDILKVNFNS